MATEIRVKRGLAYAVESVFVPRKHEGSFEVVIQTKNASAKETIDLAVEQMKKIRNGPVSTEELDTAKKYMIGNFPLRFDTQEEIASLYNQMEYFALGLDYPDKYPSLIQSITVADVRRVAGNIFTPMNASWSWWAISRPPAWNNITAAGSESYGAFTVWKRKRRTRYCYLL